MSGAIELNPGERAAIIGPLRVQLDRARMTRSDKELRYRIIDRLEGGPPLPPRARPARRA